MVPRRTNVDSPPRPRGLGYLSPRCGERWRGRGALGCRGTRHGLARSGQIVLPDCLSYFVLANSLEIIR